MGGAALKAQCPGMRIESRVRSVSWIPSEAVKGLGKYSFESGVTHYDAPLPDRLDDLEELARDDRFRFANDLSAWIEVDGGVVTAAGYSGGGLIGSTTVRVGPVQHTFQAFEMPLLQSDPEVTSAGARFVQTTGGRTGLPAPRRVRRKPFVQWRAPLVWTTLALTIGVDGSTSYEVVGASKFPRHWIYDANGALSAKVGLADFKDWYARSFGRHTPWGDEDSPALVTAAETALERQLSTLVMRGSKKPRVKEASAGTEVLRQGDDGDSLLLVLDGVVRIERDGERLAEYGPGALLGERAVVDGTTRTSTVVAVTACRFAVADADTIDRTILESIAADHRREEAGSGT
jgi:hypothetical protein